MDDRWVIAIATAVGSAAAVGTALVAWVQLAKLRKQIEQASEQERRGRTLDAIRRYENDPALRTAMQNLFQASKNGTDYTALTAEHEFDVLTILNYFDGIAMGIEQNVYIDDLARDYLETSLSKAVKALILGESGEGWKSSKGFFPANDYGPLCSLYKKWNPQATTKYRANP